MPETKQGPASAAPAAEPLAAILAEMRDPCAPRAPSLPALADRIEAAVNLREHNLGVMLATRRRDLDTVIRENEAIREQRDNLLAAHEHDRRALVAATSPGNAAVTREALMKAKLYFDHRGEGTNLDDAGMAIDAITSIDAALAAPARNCDRFATVDEAFKAWESDNKKPPEQCFLQWLFAPAEGGAE